MNCKFFCPHCGQHISTDSDVQGVTVNCPTCGGEFIAPKSIAPPSQKEPDSLVMPPPLPSAPQSYLVTAKADIARILSARKPLWLSVTLLIIATGVMAFTFRGVTFSSNAVEKLTEAISRILIAAGVVAWAFRDRSGQRKGHGFFAFSVVCAATALYSAYRLQAPLQHDKPYSQETSQRIIANTSEAFEQAASGGVPEMKPTGAAGIDAAIPAMNAFNQDLFGYLNRMEDEIHALHREDVFSVSMLSKEVIIASEIRKAVASQNIIERYKSGFQPMIEAALTKYGKLRTSGESYKGAAAVEQFRKTVGANLRRYDEMFSIRLRRQKAELDFLSFMHGAFSDYHFAVKVISFKTPSNNQRYKELVQSIDDAEKEAVAYEKRQSEAVEAAKSQIQSLAH